MKKVLAVVTSTAIASFLLGGCTDEEARKAAQGICKFVPAIGVMAQIGTAINPTLGLAGAGVAEAAAKEVCKAVTSTSKNSVARGGVKVRGVTVTGSFAK
jgi:hypothetical protein